MAEKKTTLAPDKPQVIAAIDLGSNSFHMVVAQKLNGQLKIIDRLREMVQLSAGLKKSQKLDKEAMARALACLSRFGQRLSDMHADSVRAIGTNALRVAKNPQSFLRQAQAALGHPVEIISGIEEARLVYQGTVYAISRPQEKRIVVDIGGGSTEIIIGKGEKPVHMESLFMGCVSLSEQYFDHEKITDKAFTQAIMAARQQLRPIANKFRRIGWDIEIGTSGTIKSIAEIIEHNNPGANLITLRDLHDVRAQCVAMGDVKSLQFAGIKKERMPVLPGGLAVLIAVFEGLGLEHMNFSDGALREGILFDLLGRLQLDHKDVRVTTVSALESRYAIEQEQASRVEKHARKLFNMVSAEWQLDHPEHENHLRWAARLHEIGLDIAHSSYHRHGAYLMQHMDMPGFAKNEQYTLACLIGCHRRKIRNIFFEGFDEHSVEPVKRLLVLLRLAVLLNRDRSQNDFPIKKITLDKNKLTLNFGKHWLDNSPLTMIDLEQENDYLQVLGFTLCFT